MTKKLKGGRELTLGEAVAQGIVEPVRVAVEGSSIWIMTRKTAQIGDSLSCYEIPLDEVDSAERLLGWVLHIAEKSWSRKIHLEQLIVIGCQHLNLNHRL